jgi:hypothetical protein
LSSVYSHGGQWVADGKEGKGVGGGLLKQRVSERGYAHGGSMCVEIGGSIHSGMAQHMCGWASRHRQCSFGGQRGCSDGWD